MNDAHVMRPDLPLSQSARFGQKPTLPHDFVSATQAAVVPEQQTYRCRPHLSPRRPQLTNADAFRAVRLPTRAVPLRLRATTPYF